MGGVREGIFFEFYHSKVNRNAIVLLKHGIDRIRDN